MRYRIFPAVVLLSVATSVSAQKQMEDTRRSNAPAVAARDISNDAAAGPSLKVTTRSREAERHFDRGLELAFDFRHEEARDAFEAAFRADASCALCAWGIAYAMLPMIDDAESERIARAALYAANALSGRATPVERDIISALTRYIDGPDAESRAERDAAFVGALRRLAQAYPEDGDIQALVGDALLKIQRGAESPQSAAELVRIGWATLPGGVKMRYAETGDATGQALVLVPGYSDSWYSWSLLLPTLPHDVRAIAIDPRGHGLTEYAGTDYSFDAMADDVAALLDGLGVETATIVGHSNGSLVAQAMAVRHPGRVTKLVLVGAIDRGTNPKIAELAEYVATFGETVPEGFVREFQLSTISAGVPAEFVEGVIRESALLSAAEWKAIARGLLGADYLNRLGRVNVPTLLIWGEQDQYFPLAVQQTLLATLPNARMITYEATGHAVHWERPERFAADLLRFLRKDATR